MNTMQGREQRFATVVVCCAVIGIFTLSLCPQSFAQASPQAQADSNSSADSSGTAKSAETSDSDADILRELEQMRARIQELEAKLKEKSDTNMAAARSTE